jgi:hypothetical protein
MKADSHGRTKVPRHLAIHAAGTLFFTIVLLPSQAQVSSKTFSKEDVIKLLKGDVSPKRMEELVLGRGMDFELTPEIEHQLRTVLTKSGATSGTTNSLINTLRELGEPVKMVPMVGDLGVQSGLIAKTRSDLAALRRRGDRNYNEFTLNRRGGRTPVSAVSLQVKDADPGNGKFSMNISADDRTIEKNNRSVGTPIQFYCGSEHLLYELVVWTVTNDKVSGYLSTPRLAPGSPVETGVQSVPAVVQDPEKYVAATQIEILLTPGQTVLSTKARDDLDGMVTERAKVKVGYIVEIQGVSSGAGQEGTARSLEVTSLVVRYLSVDHAVPVYRIYVVGAGAKAWQPAIGRLRRRAQIAATE